MTNVKTHVDGKKLIIEVDISDSAIKNASLSGSGKNKLLASTHSFVPLDNTNGLRLSLNLTAPK